MINSIVPVQSVLELKSGSTTAASTAVGNQTGQAVGASVQKAAAPPTAAASEKPAAQPAAQPDVRLTIEENGDHTGYVYKMVDRATGKTIAEVPREAVSQIGASDSYSVGSVVSTSA